VQAIEDMKKFRAAYTPNAKPPADYWARRTAFLNSFDNRWDIDNHTQTVRWNTAGHWMKFYRALKSMNAPVDVLPEEKDWSQYPFLVAPAYQLVDAQLIERFRKYVENGGTLILTARSGQKDRRGWLWEALWAEPIYSLIGARIPYYDVLPPGRDANVRYEGTDYQWGIWGDGLVPDAGTETLAVYSDKFLQGKAAATIRKLGKGTVAYIGVETNDGILEDSLMRLIYQRAGVKPANLPLRFVVDWRDGFWVATNFSDKAVDAPAPAGTKLLSGSKTVPPGGVAVWHE
jgi:beta-galactosidase